MQPVRTAIFGFLQAVAARDWETAAQRGGLVDTAVESDDAAPATVAALTGPNSPPRQLESAWTAYFDARTRFRLDPAGRAPAHTHWDEADRTAPEWRVAQVLIDSAEQNDWEARFTVDLAVSRARAEAVVRFEGVAPVGG